MVKNNKKAQGLSINVIIIAALALIVLVVLATIFTGRVRIFSQTLEDCASKQGQCYPNKCPDNSALITNAKCSEADRNAGKDKCCVSVFNK